MDAGTREEFWRGQRSHRGAAWRSQAAQEMTNLSSRGVAQMWDPLTIKTAKYFALRSDGPDGLERAAAAYPEIAAAITLKDDGAKTDIIKLMILADMPADSVAERVGAKPEVIDVWEQLFFDVRCLRKATSWLSTHLIDKEFKAGNGALAARMKLAVVAGVDGVNAMLAMDQGAPVDEADRLFQRKLKLSLKFDEAANMPIDSECSRMEFIKLHVNLQMSDQRLKLAEKKLAARCAAARDRCDLAKMRMEHAQEWATVRANEKQQEAEGRRRVREERGAKAASVQELQRYARLAERNAASCRAAQSPLARLSWDKSKPQPQAVSESISLFVIERPAELAREAADWEQEQFADIYPYYMDDQSGMQSLELAILGAT